MNNKNNKSSTSVCGNKNVNDRNQKIIDNNYYNNNDNNNQQQEFIRYYENDVKLGMEKCNIACVRKN